MIEFNRDEALIELVAHEMHAGIGDALAELGDSASAQVALQTIWEAETARAARLALNMRRGVMLAVDRTLALHVEVMRENAKALDPEGANSDWLDGWLSAMDTARACVAPDRDREADEVAADIARDVATLESVVGPIPVEVAEWLATIASGRLIDPAGWLRASIEGVAG